MKNLLATAIAATLVLSSSSLADTDARTHEMPAVSNALEIAVGGGYMRSAGDIGRGHQAVEGTERTLQGIEMTRVQLGVDYRVAPTFALAPYLGASAAMFIAEDTMSSNGYDEVSSNDVNWTFTAGLMARFDLPLGTN